MPKLTILVLISAFFSFSPAAEETSINHYQIIPEGDFELASEGMTPEMKERLKAHLKTANKEMEKYNNLSEEEMEKIKKQGQETLDDPKKMEVVKANLNKLPDEDKRMIEHMIKNLNKKIVDLKNPPLKKELKGNNIKLKKLVISPGTPDLLLFSDEKLSGLGNKNVGILKEKYSKLISRMDEINEIEINNYCSSEFDCMAISYGQRLSGGPAGFLTISKNDINAKAIMSRISDFTSMDKDIQSTLKGFMTGKPLEWPEVDCIRNECQIKNK